MRENLKEILQIRKEKIRNLKKNNINPFFGKFKKTHEIKDIFNFFEKIENKDVIVAGRIMAKREHGKVIFANLQDTYENIQLYIRKDNLKRNDFDNFNSLFDIGDLIGAQGEIFKTKKGEISIRVKNITLLTKSLLPLPEKFHGLKDVDLRYRQRYIDLIINKNVRKTFITRSKIIKEIRKYLDGKNFLEVETPILTSIPSGAAAKPFLTHHNKLGIPLFLRISLELPLKKLLVGGFEKVYEMGRVFRNEGISTKHNPEFTLLEIYQAYSDLRGMMDLIEDMIQNLSNKILGKTKIEYLGEKIDFNSPWKRISMIDIVKEQTKIDFNNFNDKKEAINYCNSNYKIENINNIKSKGEVLSQIFEKYVVSKLINPTIVYDYPIEISPLAKKTKEGSKVADRFELFIFGREIANAFSELNDPIEQNERFKDQIIRKKEGDQEAYEPDNDFITALKYGMPPAGGIGIGVDRLIMFLTNEASIRDIIIYPTMKDKE